MHCRTGKKSPFLRLPSERPAHPSRQRHGPAPSAWGAVAQQTTAVALHKGDPGEPGKPGRVKQLWHTGHPQREELLADIEQLRFILYIFIYLYISLYRQERFCPFYCFYIFLHSFTTLSPTSQGHISTSTSLVFVSKLPHVQGMFMFVETSPATAATLPSSAFVKNTRLPGKHRKQQVHCAHAQHHRSTCVWRDSWFLYVWCKEKGGMSVAEAAPDERFEIWPRMPKIWPRMPKEWLRNG